MRSQTCEAANQNAPCGGWKRAAPGCVSRSALAIWLWKSHEMGMCGYFNQPILISFATDSPVTGSLLCSQVSASGREKNRKQITFRACDLMAARILWALNFFHLSHA
jgi:hypothetical protein